MNDRPDRPRVLNVEPAGYSDRARQLLAPRIALEDGPLTRGDLLARAGAYDGLIVRLGHRIDAELFARATRLRFVATATTGLDHIDLEAARAARVDVLSLRSEQQFLQTVTATAELAFGLLLALARRVVPAVASVRAGEWDRDRFRGTELQGKVLAVVGVGRLGRMMCHYGTAFGMQVVGVDPFLDPVPPDLTLMPLESALRIADVISVHTKHTSGDPPVLDRHAFSKMKPGCLLINTARGEAIDEGALLEALLDNRIAGAALDVLAGENRGDGGWAQDDPLIDYARGHDNLLLTPHLGGATHESMEATEVFMAKKILAYLGLDPGTS